MPLFLRDALRHGHRLPVPRSSRRMTPTICIPAGFAARVDALRQPASAPGGVSVMTVDTITLQIFANHVRAAAENMAYTLYRTAHSTFVKETRGFYDADHGRRGHVRRRAHGSRRHLVSGHRLRPGDGDDFRITSRATSLSPTIPIAASWRRTCRTCICGSRSSMMASWSAFACGHIHNTDMGGAVPASLSRALTEVHQEGIRFPPMKLYRTRRAERGNPAGDAAERAQAGAELRRPEGVGRRAEHRRAQDSRR